MRIDVNDIAFAESDYCESDLSIQDDAEYESHLMH